MFYHFLRPLLFYLSPETAHRLTLQSLKLAHRLGFIISPQRDPTTAVTIMGLTFPNRIGLAAGLDKNGDYVDALAALGFGAVEIGTVTPRPQPGNPKPRLFRLPNVRALINRLGFNNRGVDYLCQQIKQSKFKGILGINIGKNFDTPLDHAITDYVIGLQKVYCYASYVVINISSPNTPGLRQLHYGDELQQLLLNLKKTQSDLANQHHKYVPLVVKIAPDLTPEDLAKLAATLLTQKIDGVIASNTTLSREAVTGVNHGNETGGLSGGPLFAKSLAVVQQLHQALQGRIPIIACGGVSSREEAQQMIQAGASVVQIYTALIYQGPHLVTQLATLKPENPQVCC